MDFIAKQNLIKAWQFNAPTLESMGFNSDWFNSVECELTIVFKQELDEDITEVSSVTLKDTEWVSLTSDNIPMVIDNDYLQENYDQVS